MTAKILEPSHVIPGQTHTVEQFGEFFVTKIDPPGMVLISKGTPDEIIGSFRRENTEFINPDSKLADFLFSFDHEGLPYEACWMAFVGKANDVYGLTIDSKFKPNFVENEDPEFEPIGTDEGPPEDECVSASAPEEQDEIESTSAATETDNIAQMPTPQVEPEIEEPAPVQAMATPQPDPPCPAPPAPLESPKVEAPKIEKPKAVRPMEPIKFDELGEPILGQGFWGPPGKPKNMEEAIDRLDKAKIKGDTRKSTVLEFMIDNDVWSEEYQKALAEKKRLQIVEHTKDSGTGKGFWGKEGKPQTAEQAFAMLKVATENNNSRKITAIKQIIDAHGWVEEPKMIAPEN